MFSLLAGEIRCEQPNNSLYTFTGNLIIQNQTLPVNPNQLLLRVYHFPPLFDIHKVVISVAVDISCDFCWFALKIVYCLLPLIDTDVLCSFWCNQTGIDILKFLAYSGMQSQEYRIYCWGCYFYRTWNKGFYYKFCLVIIHRYLFQFSSLWSCI